MVTPATAPAVVRRILVVDTVLCVLCGLRGRSRLVCQGENGHWCIGEHGSLIHFKAGFNSPVPCRGCRGWSVAKLA